MRLRIADSKGQVLKSLVQRKIKPAKLLEVMKETRTLRHTVLILPMRSVLQRP
jgi:hypothetical protein